MARLFDAPPVARIRVSLPSIKWQGIRNETKYTLMRRSKMQISTLLIIINSSNEEWTEASCVHSK